MAMIGVVRWVWVLCRLLLPTVLDSATFNAANVIAAVVNFDGDGNSVFFSFAFALLARQSNAIFMHIKHQPELQTQFNFHTY